MDTPLVKILLIAAAIAITVGVTVLAWSIFNEGSADVSTDQADRAISGQEGTRADGVRARISTARACEALGSAHWVEKDGNSGGDTNAAGKINGDGDTPEWVVQDTDNTDHLRDHPATQTNEGESHCAASADERSDSAGLVKKIILFTGPATGGAVDTDITWEMYTLTK